MKNYISILFVLWVVPFLFQNPLVFSQRYPVEPPHPIELSTSEPSGISIFELSSDQVKMNVTGTGQTTGHIADIHLRNLTNEDILINIPPVFIPSDGRHQSYIVPHPGTVTLPGGTTTSPAPDVIFPVNGYCADVNLPPVPLGGTVITPENWVQPRMNNFDQDGFNPILIGEDIGGEIIDWNVGEGSRGQPVIIAPFDVIVPTNPLPLDIQDLILEPSSISIPTDSPDPESDIIVDPVFEGVEIPRIIVDPKVQPELFADLALDAVLKISDAVDELIDEGVLETPLSGRSDERETIIQQTFWIYTSALKGTSYEYEDFKGILIDQFTEATGMDPEEAPESIQEEFESGAGSMWDAFVFVGEKAKVFKEFIPHSDQLKDAFGGHSLDEVKPHTDSAADAAADSIGAEAYASGRDVAFKESPDLDNIAHEAAHVAQESGQSRLVYGTSEVFEPADPPCVCGEVHVVSEAMVYRMDNNSTIANRTLIEGNTITTLTPYIDYHPPEVTVSCPDHCPASIEYTHSRTSRSEYVEDRSISWQSGPRLSFIFSKPLTFEFETTITASCGDVPCPPMQLTRTIEVIETNDCCTEIRRRNNGNLVFDAGDRRVFINGNRLTVQPKNPRERSRDFRFDFNLEAVFCNLGSDQVFGVTSSEMSSSSTGGEHSRFSNVTLTMQNGRYVLTFQHSDDSEFSFSMTLDSRNCRTMIQIFQNDRLIESIDGVILD